MKVILSVFVLLALMVAPGSSQELKRLNLDDASTIGTAIRTDAQVKMEGNGSVKVTTLWPTTICLGEVTGLSVENAQLIYKANVRSELEGSAYLEMWAQVGGGQYFSRGMNDRVVQKSEWKLLQAPFLLQKGQVADKATLNLVIDGKGTVWIDDIVLSKAPLE